MEHKKINKMFPKKRVFITGAASGLGKQLALDFARLGWRVGFCDIKKEECNITLDMIKRAGGDGFFKICDVSKWDEVEECSKEVVKNFRGVDVVINNAGVIVAGFVEDVSFEDWNWILSINLMGTIYGCKAFIPILKRQKKGYIVNIASSAGIVCLPEMGQYNVAKAGVIALSETLKQELSPYNIGVSCICPTFFKTNLMESARWGDKRQMVMAKKFFERSLCSVEDVSRCILKAIEKNRFYVIPQWDGKLLWLFKRLCPSFFYKFLSLGYKKRMFEKIL